MKNKKIEIRENIETFVNDAIKNKNLKNNKVIRIGAIGLAVIVILCIAFSSFGLNDKEAKAYMENDIYTVNYMPSDVIEQIKIDTVDSYKAHYVRDNAPAKVFIFDVQYIKNDMEYKYITCVVQREDGSFSRSLQANYGKDMYERYNTRKEAIKAIKKGLDILFK